MQEDSRGKWAVFAAILAVLALGVLLVVVLGGGSSDDEYTLTLERMQAAGGVEELVVSVPKAVNAPSVARGRPTVGLECRDGRGKVVLRKRHPWPFVDEPGYSLPHTHEPASPQLLRVIASCRLTGTTVPLAGELRLRG